MCPPVHPAPPLTFPLQVTDDAAHLRHDVASHKSLGLTSLAGFLGPTSVSESVESRGLCPIDGSGRQATGGYRLQGYRGAAPVGCTWVD